MEIRAATPQDRRQIWSILEPIFRAGETYTIDPNISEADAVAYWCAQSNRVFVAQIEDTIAGTYYVKPNQGGGGAHVCNCGFATAQGFGGKGIARAMLEHSLDVAPKFGFRAMQFNFVVANNARAIAIWERYGFDIVGRLPKAFLHPSEGYQDALVMYLEFEDSTQ